MGLPHHQHQHPSNRAETSRTIQPVTQQQQQHLTSSLSPSSSASASSSSALAMLLRPDWMRRATRMGELRKERVTVTIYKSLRQRQKELGLVTTTEEEAIKSTDDPTSSNSRKKKNKTTRNKKAMPQRYRVVSSAMINTRNQNNNNNNNTSSHACEDATSGRYDALNVYLFLPENNLDLNDKSNIIYRLDHGEIITSTTKKTVPVAVEDDKQQAQQQQQKQQQQQQQQSTAVLWIEHDRGGWSPSIVNGVTRLVPIEYEP